ncbi:MAG: COG1361 S-layer family protein, partial [Thermoplasmata archaeon]
YYSYFGIGSHMVQGTPDMRNVPMTVIMVNNGNDYVQNVHVSYRPDGYLNGSLQNYTIPAMKAFGNVPVTFIVSIRNDAPTGFVNQTMNVSYNGITRSVSFRVPITGYSNITLITAYTDPPVIYTGQNFIKLGLVLANSGSSFATGVNVSITSDDFMIVTNNYSIPYFAPGTLNLTFYIDSLGNHGWQWIDVKAGSHVFPIHIYVHETGVLKVKEKQTTLTPGVDKSLITFNITNTGNETMRGINLHLLSPSIVSIHVSSSDPLAALTANNVTIGSLSPNQKFTVTFIVDTAGSASSGKYPAQLYASWYYNNTPDSFSSSYNFNLSVSPTIEQSISDDFTFNYVTITILVIIIAAIISFAVISYSRRDVPKKIKHSSERPEEKREEKQEEESNQKEEKPKNRNRKGK